MIVTVILALALFSGGILSVVNAADIGRNYVNSCPGYVRYKRRSSSYFDKYYMSREMCDDFERIRDSQVATAVSDFNM